MSKQKIFEEIEKADIFRRATIGHYAIINLKNFPDWDTLLIYLAHKYRKYKYEKVKK